MRAISKNSAIFDAETMILNSTANQSMKSKLAYRFLLSACAIALGSFQVSCSTSSSGAWSRIQSDGLIQFLADGQSDQMLGESVPQEREIVQEIVEVESAEHNAPLFRSGVVTAQPVEHKPGFVYSPHTEKLLIVDVSDYKPGVRVRCPYTKKSFVVPGMPEMLAPSNSRSTQMVASTPVRQTLQSSSRVQPQQVAAKPSAQSINQPIQQDELVAAALKKETFEKIEISDNLPVDPLMQIPRNQAPPTSEPLALPKKEAAAVPIGKRVPGKPNYVYSPFASSNQVVDVEGHSAGTKVKCPYTGKVFAVPAAAAASGE
ncbi:MAG: hypothetical protein ACI9UA_000764 [Pseudoalteromonas tetraodonis]